VIQPTVVIAYNGSDDSFPCDVRRPNMGHSHGDHDLTMSGYNHFKTINDGFRFIKIGIDTFMLNEDALIWIFNDMEIAKSCYAGNYWHYEGSQSLATDIMFLDTRYGNPLNPPHGLEKNGDDFETWMFNSVNGRKLPIMLLGSRTPVHPSNRMECERYKWTMHHQLEANLENMRKWGFGHLV